MSHDVASTRTSTVLAFTDLVGYSAVSQRNEREALALLDTHRALVRAALPAHRGVEVKTIGDAFLLEFPSVLDGLGCLIDIQQRHREHNATAGAEPIRMRAALHIGDVERREGDILGDSVNVVARLQGQAPVGGIAVSGQIHSLLRSRPEIASRLRSIGMPELKNMAAPIEVFVLDPEQGTDGVVAWWARLKRSRTLAWVAGYGAVAWLLVQGAATASEVFELPPVFARVVFALALWGVPVTAVLAWHHGVPGRQRMRMAEMLLLGVCVVGAGASMASLVLTPTPPRVATVISPEASPGAPREISGRSIAVLPFVNMSPDPEQEYFSDGLAEELLNSLSNVGELKVTARTSSFAFKGKNVPVQEIANTLGVANLLEGSVRRAGDRLRVTAQLIRAKDGFRYWSRSYDRTLDDVFAIQEEIARSVVDELKITLLAESSAALGDRGTTDITAYDAYLRGLKEFNAENGSAMQRAVRHFEEASRLDPRFLEAWWWLWRAQGMLAVYGLISMDETDRLREVALAGAEATGRVSADLEYMRGVAQWRTSGRRDTSESRARYEAAVRLDPKHYFARRELVHIDYSGQQMLERRMQLHEEEVARDPLSVAMNRALAANCLDLGRLTRAQELADRMKTLAPQSYWGPTMSADVAVARGDLFTAYVELTEARRRDALGILPIAAGAALLAEVGDLETARPLAEHSADAGVENYAALDIALLTGDEAAVRSVRDEAAEAGAYPDVVASLDAWFAIRQGNDRAALERVLTLFEERDAPTRDDAAIYLAAAWLHSKVGDAENASRLLAKVERFLGTPGYESPVLDFLRVDWLAVSGRGAEALDLLQGLVSKGYRPGSWRAHSLLLAEYWRHYLQPWRADPRYAAVDAELGRRAALIREQIATWNREHPEEAAHWVITPGAPSISSPGP